ncbi:SDR family NAD(P)-dependent oxidoreductase [Patulibacter sp.]|uniref:SDR family NAD(P)-dependent oxidoreductase n=1 Tax=Patulibacter sp. TaxID=1912859 RepID=UPI0027218239|nr:SDR family NAD(P)-dependent oxidoreductase [Patulibacter sp.]MDO9410404.1 SDR family NAD(P)-dependent oxidoreductase [Patulibacter sp.]
MPATPTTQPRVWFVTGAGRGLGRAFVAAALDRGDRVIGTVRSADALADLQGRHADRLRVLQLDVRGRDAVRRVVDEAAGVFGRLDVVVNNAGYGLVGATEELSEDDARDHVDTNLLGPLWVTQAALPHMRAQGSGELVQISTVGAVGSMPLLGLYNAGKWGLEGFSEALAGEVAAFGVRVTIAQLGGFDTDWGTTSMRFADPQGTYDGLRESLFGTAEVPWPPTAEDPHPLEAPPGRAAAALLEHLDRGDDRPLRLLVGDNAPGHVALALDRRREDYSRDARFSWPADPGSASPGPAG